MKRLSLLGVLLHLAFISQAESYVRYNQLGFDPGYDKIFTIMSESSLQGVTYSIFKNNETVLSGQLTTSISGAGSHSPFNFHYEIDASELKDTGDYSLQVDGHSCLFRIASRPEEILISSLLRYLRVQRSGSSAALDHGLSHLGDASCPVMVRSNGQNTNWQASGTHGNVEMTGGWYDAGDYIKFTLTTAYTTYYLLRAYQTDPEWFNSLKVYSQTAMPDMLDEAQWGLRYLLKTMPNAETFIIQTGDVDDHNQGYRMPEDDQLDGNRNAYHAFSKTQMGYTAAALALGSQVFAEYGESELADSCLNQAIQVYNAANTSNESNAWFAGQGQVFYGDNSEADNMLLAATELFFATNQESYLDDAGQFSSAAGAGYWASWGNINMHAQGRLALDNNSAIGRMRTDVGYFYGKSTEANNPFGVPHNYTWASLYSFLTVGYGAVFYESITEDDQYRSVAVDMHDYLLGRNNWGVCMIASEKLPFGAPTVENIYSQYYVLQPHLFPEGGLAEGPGDKATHDVLGLNPETEPWDQFSTSEVVFYDDEHDYMTMETTIGGLADAIYFLSAYMAEYHDTSMVTDTRMNYSPDPVKRWEDLNLPYDLAGRYIGDSQSKNHWLRAVR